MTKECDSHRGDSFERDINFYRPNIRTYLSERHQHTGSASWIRYYNGVAVLLWNYSSAVHTWCNCSQALHTVSRLWGLHKPNNTTGEKWIQTVLLYFQPVSCSAITPVHQVSYVFLINYVKMMTKTLSQAAQWRCTVVRPVQKSIGKWEIRPPVKL